MLLEFLTTSAASSAIGKLRERVRPNAYAPNLPDQARQAADQAIRPNPPAGTSGLAGSEADWYTDAQGVSSIGQLDNLFQDLPSRAIPPSYFTPWDPGRDPSDPTTLRDFYDGPVTPELVWGGNQRAQAPHVIAARINEPTRRTPLPRELVQSRGGAVPQGAQDALDLAWGG